MVRGNEQHHHGSRAARVNLIVSMKGLSGVTGGAFCILAGVAVRHGRRTIAGASVSSSALDGSEQAFSMPMSSQESVSTGERLAGTIDA
jgi:hypothetical protein